MTSRFRPPFGCSDSFASLTTGGASIGTSRASSLVSFANTLLFPTRQHASSTNSLPADFRFRYAPEAGDSADEISVRMMAGIPVMTRNGRVVCYCDRKWKRRTSKPDVDVVVGNGLSGNDSHGVTINVIAPEVDGAFENETSRVNANVSGVSVRMRGSIDSDVDEGELLLAERNEEPKTSASPASAAKCAVLRRASRTDTVQEAETGLPVASDERSPEVLRRHGRRVTHGRANERVRRYRSAADWRAIERVLDKTKEDMFLRPNLIISDIVACRGSVERLSDDRWAGGDDSPPTADGNQPAAGGRRQVAPPDGRHWASVSDPCLTFATIRGRMAQRRHHRRRRKWGLAEQQSDWLTAAPDCDHLAVSTLADVIRQSAPRTEGDAPVRRSFSEPSGSAAGSADCVDSNVSDVKVAERGVAVRLSGRGGAASHTLLRDVALADEREVRRQPISWPMSDHRVQQSLRAAYKRWTFADFSSTGDGSSRETAL